MNRETIFSECRKYRYVLWRGWDIDLLTGCADDPPNAHGFVQFIGLNPSVADEKIDDPTIRRCIDFAKRWGYGAMCMTNLFGFRATDPKEMKAHAEMPFARQENDSWINRVATEASLTVCAWGKDGSLRDRGDQVRHHLQMVRGLDLYHLGLNSDGSPKHPLYLKKTLTPILWT